MRIKKLLLAAFLCSQFLFLKAQENNKLPGEIHGNFEMTTQFYSVDTIIGAPIVPEKVLMNGFLNLIYTKDKFTAGLRYETYQNVLQGFDPGYAGSGIPFRYATYSGDLLEITAGNFYEQFGSGLIFRSYEERGLGVDNAMEGMRVKAKVRPGIYLKGMIGRQRLFFAQSNGIVRGIDGEFNLNEAFEGLAEKKTKVILGSSFVSKYQADDNVTYNLPENVAAGGGRLNLIRGNFSIFSEYVYKANDPSADNNFIYKPGQAFFISTSYSTRGFGLNLSAKHIDNMSFRSDRNENINNLLISYLPALTKQHTYNLAATLYPYATQPTGEVGFQADLTYKLKKGTWYGGKYGTSVLVNYAAANGLDTTSIDDLNTTRQAYKTNIISTGDNVFFRDFNIEVTRKLSKEFKLKASYFNFIFNNDVMKLAGKPGIFYVDIAVIDLLYKFNKTHSLRTEFQNMWTKQDQGNWATFLAEYSLAPHWFFSFMDQYNYGNPVASKRLHYPIFSSGYNTGGTRIMASYGRQRAGIFCVGGVCRTVPASNGVTLSITSSF